MTAHQPPPASSRVRRAVCRPSAPLRVGLGQLRGVVAVLGLLLAVVAGTLIFAAAPASALTIDQTGERVAAINPSEPTPVETDSLLRPRSPPASAGIYDNTTSGCCVAPRTAGLADEVVSSSRYTRTSFGGNRVYQRGDLIDPSFVDDVGRTNLQRMQSGLAPIGPDGRSLQLHHLTQRQSGAIAEVTATMHQQNSRILHINPSSIPSGIDRGAFNVWRGDYWRWRAKDF